MRMVDGGRVDMMIFARWIGERVVMVGKFEGMGGGVLVVAME
jgi:hypothetical protein